MSFCSNCGLQHKDGFKFCTSCGTKIEPDEQPRTQAYGNTIHYNHLDGAGKSLQTLSTFLIVLLYIGIALYVIDLFWAIFKWESYVELVKNDDSISFLIFVPFFLVRYFWIYKASQVYNEKYDNMEYTPLMAVAWFFIPVANLFMPFLVIKDLCKNNIVKEPCLLWYIFYLFECITFTFSMAFSENSEAIAKISVFFAFTSIFSSYFFARIVSGIRGKDTRKYGG
jgi:hypothetical protein